MCVLVFILALKTYIEQLVCCFWVFRTKLEVKQWDSQNSLTNWVPSETSRIVDNLENAISKYPLKPAESLQKISCMSFFLLGTFPN